MLKRELGSSLKLFVFFIGLILINHTSYGSSADDDNQPRARPSLIEQGSLWAQEHPILFLSAVAATGAVLYYCMPQEDEPFGLDSDDCPDACPFYIKPEQLYAVAENTSESLSDIFCDDYTSRIYGWVSNCYDPHRYNLVGFQDCYEACLEPLSRIGISGAECFDYVRCWAQHTTDTLTCDFFSPGWTVTNKTFFNDSGVPEHLGWRYGDVAEWWNRTNLYLYDIGFEHPNLDFHWQAGSRGAIRTINEAWQCLTKAWGLG